MKKTVLDTWETVFEVGDETARIDANFELDHDATVDPQRYEDSLLMALSMFRREWLCNRCNRVRLTIDKQEMNTYPTLAKRLMKPCKSCQTVGYLRLG